MKYISEELFNKYILYNNYIEDSEKLNIVNDILLIVELSNHKVNVIKNIKIEDVLSLSAKSLALLHGWENELYAIQFFIECSINPPTTDIFDNYVT